MNAYGITGSRRHRGVFLHFFGLPTISGMTCTMGFYVQYVAFVLNLPNQTLIGLPSPYCCKDLFPRRKYGIQICARCHTQAHADEGTCLHGHEPRVPVPAPSSYEYQCVILGPWRPCSCFLQPKRDLFHGGTYASQQEDDHFLS